MSVQPLYPRQQVPALSVKTVAEGTWTLAEQTPPKFTLVVFYRGLHCPICRTYLRDLQANLDDLEALGVNTIAISSDDEERATRVKNEWKLENIRIGYGLSLEDARKWGLYISTSRGTTSIGVVEPDMFSEPAIYLVRPDGTLYFGNVQTMPFARPHFADIVKAIKFVIEKDYPARGEVIAIP